MPGVSAGDDRGEGVTVSDLDHAEVFSRLCSYIETHAKKLRSSD
jgi:hypothetical protein